MVKLAELGECCTRNAKGRTDVSGDKIDRAGKISCYLFFRDLAFLGCEIQD